MSLHSACGFDELLSFSTLIYFFAQVLKNTSNVKHKCCANS